jgi:hypothetical protein
MATDSHSVKIISKHMLGGEKKHTHTHTHTHGKLKNIYCKLISSPCPLHYCSMVQYLVSNSMYFIQTETLPYFKTNRHHSMLRDGLRWVLKIGFLHMASITSNRDTLLNHYPKS